jgi:hypothetical protein
MKQQDKLPPYVQPITKKNGLVFRYFRRGKIRIPLPGDLGSIEFRLAYENALRLHAPEKLNQQRRGRGGIGSLGWVIAQYKSKSSQWKNATASTREIYDRRHHWLAENYGDDQLADFDRELVKQIRDLPDFADKPSVADATVERLATLWSFADEFLHLANMRKHRGVNPAKGIRKLKESGTESAPLWPLDLCKAIENHPHRDIVSFYYLARYTGQAQRFGHHAMGSYQRTARRDVCPAVENISAHLGADAEAVDRASGKARAQWRFYRHVADRARRTMARNQPHQRIEPHHARTRFHHDRLKGQSALLLAAWLAASVRCRACPCRRI